MPQVPSSLPDARQFELSAGAQSDAKRKPFPWGHRERVGHRKLGSPADFRWYAWRFIHPDTVLLTGCVSSGTVTKGKRKGWPRFDGKKVEVAVSDAEIESEKQRYEAETGHCAECMGEGKVVSGWNHETGVRLRECKLCCGTGEVQL